MEEKYSLSESEELIWEILQKESPLSMQEIIKCAKEQKDWADSTIKTFVRRMVKKGALVEKQDKVMLFFPAYAEETRKKVMLQEVVDKFFKGAYQKALLCFCEEGQVTKEELQEVMEQISREE